MALIGTKLSVIKRIRISDQKLRLIVRCFCVDLTALQTSKLVGVNRKTVDRYFIFLRVLVIANAVSERKESRIGNGIEIDESYFGARRQRGKRGRGASRKIIVLGLLKRKGKVFTGIVPNAKKESVMPIIRRVVRSGADIYTDGWASYDALAVYGYNHKKVKHEDNEFAREDGTHINGIESFWSFAKRRLSKFNGIPKRLFQVNLLETEWRFNHRNDIMRLVKELIKDYQQGLIVS
jgi:transposase-like protein